MSSENDGKNRFRIESKNNANSAQVQRKTAKMAVTCISIIKTFYFYTNGAQLYRTAELVETNMAQLRKQIT